MTRRADEARYSLESIDRMAAVIEALESTPELTLDRIAAASGLNESTALRYLMSLSKHGYVERNASGAFNLGLRFFRLGSLALGRRDISGIARPVMDTLLRTFAESVNLAARQQTTIVLVSVLESPNPLRKGARAGETDSWHSTSLGKALLAGMEPSAAETFVSSLQLTPYTPNTMTTTATLLRDIEAARSRGYAVDDEESVEGLRCVGAAIQNHDGMPLYAISVSGPKSRMSYSRIQEIGTTLVAGAATISRGLGVK